MDINSILYFDETYLIKETYSNLTGRARITENREERYRLLISEMIKNAIKTGYSLDILIITDKPNCNEVAQMLNDVIENYEIEARGVCWKSTNRATLGYVIKGNVRIGLKIKSMKHINNNPPRGDRAQYLIMDMDFSSIREFSQEIYERHVLPCLTLEPGRKIWIYETTDKMTFVDNI